MTTSTTQATALRGRSFWLFVFASAALLAASCGESTDGSASGDIAADSASDVAGVGDVGQGDGGGNGDATPADTTTGDATTGDGTAGDGTAGDGTAGDGTAGDDGSASDTATADDTAAQDTTSGDTALDDSTIGDDTAGDDTAGGDTTGGDAVDPDGGGDAAGTACPGGVGCSCKLDSDCGSAACAVWSNGTKQCAKPCSTDDDCDKGTVCDGPSGGAVCLPKAIALCAPCIGNNECQVAAPGGACVAGGAAGAFCGTACTNDADCTDAVANVCSEVKDIEGNATKQCVPASGASCGCSDYAIAKFAKTLCFADGQPGCSATRQCLPAGATGAPNGGGLSTCAPQPASDEVCDGLDNDCDGQTDEGGAALCDDSNVCTTDACAAGKGCSHAPAPGACNDDDACTDKDACAAGLCAGVTIACDDGDACTADTCDAQKGCQYAPISATDTVLAPCNDNNACTDNDSCKDGKCAGTKVVCDDANPCTNDACDLASGCTVTANTAKCSDNDACTSGDTCVATACVGAKIDCDDSNVCTDDSCDPAKGCQHLYAKGDCDDGNACTLKDTCVNGDCKGTLLDELKGKGCEDDNPCTDVACDLAIGCTLVNNTKGCDDGDACTTKDTCKGGSCAGAKLDCDDDNACTNDSCDSQKGCSNVANTAACDDGDPCTESDLCGGTVCKGQDKNCDDGNACTGESCKGGVCLSEALTGTSCSDSSACSSGDICSADGACTGKPISCDDGNACTDDPCDPKAGCAAKVKSTKPCDDGTACTKDDACDGKGNCKGAVVDCNDNNACTADSCDPGSGCVNKATTEPCNDGTACTTQDTCQDGKCVGVAANCDDGNPCTTDGCDKSGGCSHTANTIACDDGDTCSELDACKDGKCAGKAKNCDDDNTCTADACKGGVCLSTALTGTGCDDGTACTSSDLCDGAGKCAGKVISCDDGNPCTDDACDPKVGCAAKTPNTKPCDDGSACTKDDTCDGKGACKGTPLITASADACDDNNSCTSDGCDPATGCFHKANTLPCDDGDSCTGGAAGDKCAGGKCVPGAQVCKCKIDTDCDAQNPNPCLGAQICTAGQCALKLGTAVTCTDDGDSCSLEACDPKTGTCATTPAKDGVACDKDGTVCTANDACASGKCTAGKVVDCDDSNPCTQDSCNKLIGCVHAATAGACSDGDACTDKDSCVNGSCAPGAKVDCDDGNACTKDACDAKAVDAAAACTHTGLDATPCDDGNPCSEADACAKGVCKAGGPKSCDDGNPCTTDSCGVGGKCTNVGVPDGATCDDGVPCFASDACAAGVCKAGKVAKCDDGKACTTDVCDDKTGGCSYTTAKDGTPCVDGKPCTAAACSAGACVVTGPKVCDDGDACTRDEKCDAASNSCKVGSVETCDDGVPCTTDSCDAKSGGCSHVTQSPCKVVCKEAVDCADGNLCTTASCSAQGVCVYTPSHDGELCGNGGVCDKKGKCGPITKGWATQITAGSSGDFFCVRTWNGHVACWGDNGRNQIGAATGKAVHLQPLYLSSISNVRLVRAGRDHACALDADGATWCWGDNTYGESSPSGSLTTTTKPTLVKELPPARDLALGERFTCALLMDDTVRCWGFGSSYRTGLNTTVMKLTPTQVPGLTGVRSIFARTVHACALRGDGGLWCWGSNANKSTSDLTGSFTPVPTAHPTPLAGLRTIGGTNANTCMANGTTIQCFGRFAEGQGGNGGTPAASATPLDVLLKADVVGLAGGGSTLSLLTRDGLLWMTGVNSKGQFGDGTQTSQLKPVRSGFAPVVVDVAVTLTTSCAVGSNGQVYCSGEGLDGQLGIGQLAAVSVPQKVLGFCMDDAMCDDGNTCTTETCNAGTGLCEVKVLTGGACEDGDACTDQGACAAGACTAGKAKTCNDNDPCTTDSCNSVAGCMTTAAPNGTSCSDGDPCSTVDGCAGGVCKGVTLKDCSDGNPCTVDACDKASGACTATFDPSCSPPCTSNGDCDDSDGCTTDTCVVATGKCTHSAEKDGAVCSGGLCASGVCAPPTTGWATTLETNPYNTALFVTDAKGDVWSWGSCSTYKLCANDSVSPQPQPTKVAGLSKIQRVTLGIQHGCAQDEAGKIYCWGSNTGWQMGDLGKPAGVEGLPVEISQLAGVTSLLALHGATCGIANGKVRCLGTNAAIFGDGDVHKQAKELSLAEPVTDLVGDGTSLCARAKSSRWICWGTNTSRALVDSTTTLTTPAAFGAELRYGDVSVFPDNLCWVVGGVGQCRGSNGSGQLGVPGAPSGFAFASMPASETFAFTRLGGGRALAVTRDGKLFGAGKNDSYQLAMYSPSGVVPSWTRVPTSEVVVDVGGTMSGTCVLTAKGQVLCTGGNTSSSPLGVTGIYAARALQMVRAPCQGDAECTEGNPCTDETCSAGVCSVALNSASCDDDKPCTTPDKCSWGQCSGTINNNAPCDDGNPCTTDACSGGTCQSTSAPCDDDDFCTVLDECKVVDGKAACSGVTIAGACDDGNACTSDACIAATGACKSTILPSCSVTCSNDGDCDDDNRCTQDACVQGACTYAATDAGLVCGIGRTCQEGTCASPAAGWASKIRVGGSLQAVLTRDHRVYTWGAFNGQEILKPKQVAGLSGVMDLEVGQAGYGYCAIRQDGKVLCAGSNYYGDLGTGDKVALSTPTEIKVFEGAKMIAMGAGSTCVYTSGTSVLCVGFNGYGQLGNGTTKDSLTPVEAKLPWKPVRLVAGDYTFCAVSASNEAMCWGANDYSTLAAGGQALTVPKSVESVAHPELLEVMRSMRAWFEPGEKLFVTGYNTYGNLGVGKFSSETVAKTELTYLKDPRQLVFGRNSGAYASYVLDKDGVIWAAGTNYYGSLGTNNTTSSATFIKSLLGPKAVAVASTGALACAVSSSGRVYCTGGGYFGDGKSYRTSTAWVEVKGPCLSNSGCSDGKVCTKDTCDPTTEVCTYTNLASGVACQDGVICTENDTCNGSGTCQGGKTAPCSDDDPCTLGDTCVAVDGKKGCAGQPNVWCDDGKPCTLDSCNPSDGKCVSKLMADCAVGCTSNDECYDEAKPCTEGVCNLISGTCSQIALPDDAVCGERKICKSGTCGDVPSTLPRAIDAYGTTSCGVNATGVVKCWGYSAAWQAGVNQVYTDSAATVAGTADAVDVQMTSQASAMLDSKGDVYGWGYPQYGQLAGHSGYVAAKLGGLPAFTKLRAGYANYCGLTANGQVHCWGYGSTGSMGDGTTAATNVAPHAVKNLPSDVVDLNGGGGTYCAITAKGEAWCWGDGGYCQMDTNCTLVNALPVKLAAPSSVRSAWVGQLGMMLPGRGAQLLFVGTSYYGHGAIGALDYTKVLSATATLGNVGRPVMVKGLAGATLALTSHGMYGAGSNASAQLAMDSWGGQIAVFAPSSQINKYKPIAMATGDGHSCFICLDGAVRCLGANYYGQIGAGYASPTEGGLRVVNWF